MQQIQRDIWFFKEGLKSMFNYYKRHGFLSDFSLEFLPSYIATWLLIILFYRFIYTIEKCIKNRKIGVWDLLYIILNRLNRNFILDTDGFERFTLKLFTQVLIDCVLFVVLHIMYKEKIQCKKKDENNKEEKPHAD